METNRAKKQKSTENESSFQLHYPTGNKLLMTDPNIHNDIEQTNPLLYNLNFNPYKKGNHSDNAIKIDNDKLRDLKKLAFSKQGDSMHYEPMMSDSTKKVKFYMKIANSRKNLNAVKPLNLSENKAKIDRNAVDPHESRFLQNPESFFTKFAENPDQDMKKNGNLH